MITNVPAKGPEEGLPRIAWRIGRAIQFPNAFEAVVGWDRNPAPDLGERLYRRQVGLVFTFPVVRGRFSLKAFR